MCLVEKKKNKISAVGMLSGNSISHCVVNGGSGIILNMNTQLKYFVVMLVYLYFMCL